MPPWILLLLVQPALISLSDPACISDHAAIRSSVIRYTSHHYSLPSMQATQWHQSNLVSTSHIVRRWLDVMAENSTLNTTFHMRNTSVHMTFMGWLLAELTAFSTYNKSFSRQWTALVLITKLIPTKKRYTNTKTQTKWPVKSIQKAKYKSKPKFNCNTASHLVCTWLWYIQHSREYIW